ncbi:peroxiredoxin [Halomonas aestuarii]|uniref:Glutathione-dependent peroxiredoxin n=1 Tax=Halomonas aestuarii TaxID=1897729 RepID=A0A1J0VHT3_9GAMM|nr:peroxiredoxin [Halomonas aestuarii]APE31584.1 peroxiredoxin [Halomonas aestuarii]
MTIQIGDTLPDITLKTNGPDGPRDLSTGEFFADRRVVLFAVPGAFTPNCSETHVPGFVVRADVILARGVDEIACLSVNDAFVLGAWQKDQNAGAITMLADGNADFTRAIGMDKDASAGGMGIRSHRYALIATNGVVEYLGIDTEKGVVDKSSAETILDNLPS